MQIKTTMRYHFIPSNVAVNRRNKRMNEGRKERGRREGGGKRRKEINKEDR